MKHIITIVAAAVLAGCSADADVASRNLSKAADMF
jgi:outer membrane biogenesis lipoprotein LolB